MPACNRHFVKSKLSLGEVKLKATLGVKKRGTALYGNSGSRLLAASSRGFDLKANYKDLGVYFTQINGASNRESSALVKDLTVDGKKLDYIRIVGATYKLGSVKLRAERLVSKDYLKKNFAEATYTLPFVKGTKLELNGRYGLANENGALAGKFEKSSYYNLNAKVKFADSHVLFGYNKTNDGDWADGNGSPGNSGSFNSSLSQWASYSKKGEQAFVVSAAHKFAAQGLPGLSASMWYANGRNADDFTSDKELQTGFKRSEVGGTLTYSFDGQLKGLKVKWLHVSLDEKSDQKDFTLDRSNRLYLTYTKTIF